ncbi:MAG: hydroxyacylglutathione hydrolase [Parvularculaceae bacterium]|jgi:hydroxyacylglutathione hydrolase|nr:hydroxyacylglutathione hydrolase [Parvularculaceae bacterium]
MIIRQFPCLKDNYGFLLRDEASGAVAAVDTPDAAAIDRELEAAGWRLTHILNTHWHPDHAGGNLALKARWSCRIIGPKREAARIPGLDEAVGEGDEVRLGEAVARVIDTPGHTLGHVVFHFLEAGCAFVGDTIFAMGCGRLFEGTPSQMWASLLKVAALPAATELYCAHEYTEANARFALSVDGANAALRRRAAAVDAMRARGAPTVPTRLADELETNPFLRAPAIAASLGLSGVADAEAFAELRRRKDQF